MNYLMVLQVKYFATDDDNIYIDSAFWNHLLVLQSSLSNHNIRLTVALIYLGKLDTNEEIPKGLIRANPNQHGFNIIPVFPEKNISAFSKANKLKNFVRIFKHIYRTTRKYDVIHTGLSYDIYLPTSFFASLSAILQKKPLVYVVDIDFRNSAKMLYKSGEWSLSEYITNYVLHDSLKKFQLLLSVKFAKLALLKGRKFAADFSSWGNNVEPFYDTVHMTSDLLDKARIQEIVEQRQSSKTLNLVYFGRIVKYKGLQDLLYAMKRLAADGINDIKLTVIGNGDYHEDIRQLTEQLNLTENVKFIDSIPYGELLFNEIRKHDALVAFPQREDTPRSAFDAMLQCLPIVAYDTYYYKELSESGAIFLCDWKNLDSISAQLKNMREDKSKLVAPSKNAAKFAAENTQDFWVNRRLELTIKAIKTAD